MLDATLVSRLLEERPTDGEAYELAGPLSGGHQSGAWQLRRRGGGDAVLKVTTDPRWAQQVWRAEPAVARVRAAGYPTPAWVEIGHSPEDVTYVIQERAPGRSVDRIDLATARMMAAVIERHQGLDPDPHRNWSDYLATQFASLAAQVEQLGSTTIGSALHPVCRRLLGPDPAALALPRSDLVHGDFRPANILVEGGRLTAVLDIEALGSGTRAFDYATLLDHEDIDTDALRFLISAGVGVAGSAVLRACFALVALDLVQFLDRQELTDRTCIARIEELRRRAELLDHLTRT